MHYFDKKFFEVVTEALFSVDEVFCVDFFVFKGVLVGDDVVNPRTKTP